MTADEGYLNGATPVPGSPDLVWFEDVEVIPDDGRPHWLYTHYDEFGDVLYVGQTVNPDTRPRVHRRTTWWSLVDRTEIDGPFTKPEVCLREMRAIKELDPPFNTRKRTGYWTYPRRVMTREAYIAMRQNEGALAAAATSVALAEATRTAA